MLFIQKAAVRAMDATQQFLRQEEIQVPEKFVVSGASPVR
jgi:PhoPQ-activated pathogenicity-related protein